MNRHLLPALLLVCLAAFAAQPAWGQSPSAAQTSARWGGGSVDLPAPDAMVHSYARYRSRWYAGLGLGAGLGWIDDARGYDQAARFGPAVSMRAGLVARPWLLLGVEGSHWAAPDDAGWLQIFHASVVASLFLLEDLGLFLKAGVGGGIALLEAEDGSGQRADGGVAVKVGLGYELQIGKRLTAGLDLTFAHTSYSGGSVDHLCLRLILGIY